MRSFHGFDFDFYRPTYGTSTFEEGREISGTAGTQVHDVVCKLETLLYERDNYTTGRSDGWLALYPSR